MSGFSQLMNLYDKSARRSVLIASLLSSVLGLLDFLSLLALYPVLMLITNPSKSSMRSFHIGTLTVGPMWLAVLACSTIIFRSILGLAFRKWWLKAANEAEARLSDSLLRKYAYADFSFHLENNSSKLLARNISSVDQLTTCGLIGFVSLVTELALLVGLVTALIFVSPTVGITVGLYVVVMLSVFNIATRLPISQASISSNRAIHELYNETSQILTGIRELSVYDVQERHLDRVVNSRAKRLNAKLRINILLEIPRILIEVFLYLTILIALVYLIKSNNRSSALSLVGLYVIASLRILPSVSRALNYLGQIKQGLSISREIHDEFLDSRLIESKRTREGLPKFEYLTFENIWFTYSANEKPTLKNIQAKIPFGSFVGIIGQSGSGKTTLVNLLLGLLKPTQGKLLLTLPSSDVIELSGKYKVSFVPQDVYILDSTLRDNIEFGRPPIGEQELRDIVRDVDLAEFVDGLPNGLETRVGERGNQLSAGQRQRVGIARALYADPSLIIFDEPTSSLDAETEKHIMETIFKLRGKATIFCIAHRTNTLKDCDILLEMEDGVLKSITHAG